MLRQLQLEWEGEGGRENGGKEMEREYEKGTNSNIPTDPYNALWLRYVNNQVYESERKYSKERDFVPTTP